MVLFPTFVVGSLPRPLWIRELIETRKRKNVSENVANRLLDDAVPFAMRMQEQCGLDFVSDGEWRRESYVKVFADAMDGFQPDLISGGGSQFSALRYPAIVSRLVKRRSIAVDEAAFVRARTERKVIVAIPSPYTVAWRMWSPEYSRECYPTREDFMQACIPIVRDEIRALAEQRIDAVQLDDPWLVQLVDPAYRKRVGITDIEHEIEQCITCVNGATDGIEGVLLSVHL